MELATGRDMLVIALLVAAVLSTMWILSATRRHPAEIGRAEDARRTPEARRDQTPRVR